MILEFLNKIKILHRAFALVKGKLPKSSWVPGVVKSPVLILDVIGVAQIIKSQKGGGQKKCN